MHNIACGSSTAMWFEEIVERRDRLCERGRTEFDDIVKTVGTMLWCKRPIWNCTKVVIMDIGFCVTKGLLELRKK